MELTEEDGYEGVVEEIEALKMKIHSGGTDINPNRLLNQNHDSNQVLKTSNKVVPTVPHSEEEKEEKGTGGTKELKDIRVLLGTVEDRLKKYIGNSEIQS